MSGMTTPPGTNNPYDPKHPPRCAPIWGFPMNWAPGADLEPSYSEAVQILTQVSVTTLSDTLVTSGQGIKITAQLQGPTVTGTIELQDNAGNVLASWTVDSTHTVFHASNLEFIQLAGQAIKIRAVSPANGWISVSAVGVTKHDALSGAQVATTTAAPLAAQPCHGVRVKNNGTESLLVGGAGRQDYVIAAGQSEFFDVNNAGDIWVKASATTVAVCWFAKI